MLHSFVERSKDGVLGGKNKKTGKKPVSDD